MECKAGDRLIFANWNWGSAIRRADRSGEVKTRKLLPTKLGRLKKQAKKRRWLYPMAK